MHLQTDKRFHNLTLEQLQTLDQVLTEVIPIHGRGNFPTLQVRAKDIIRVVKERLVERDIQVKDIRLNGASASHVLVRDAGLGSSHLDIIFGVELPRQEDFQVIKEVVLGSLRDLLPSGVNRRRITCLTMKEAYVQKMVKIFTEHDRWSLISLSHSRAKTVALRFVSALRRQFEFSVDSFQIILDRMLESYWETERRHAVSSTPKRSSLSQKHLEGEDRKQEPLDVQLAEGGIERTERDLAAGQTQSQHEPVGGLEMEPPRPAPESRDGECDAPSFEPGHQGDEDRIEDADSEEDPVLAPCGETCLEKHSECPVVLPPEAPFSGERDPNTCLKMSSSKEMSQSAAPLPGERHTHGDVPPAHLQTDSSPSLQDSSPPPAKKTCSSSQEVLAGVCRSPALQRKMSRKQMSPVQWSFVPDCSDLSAQLKPLQPKPEPLGAAPALRFEAAGALQGDSEDPGVQAAPAEDGGGQAQQADATVKPKHSQKPPSSAEPPARSCAAWQQEPPAPVEAGSGSRGFSSSITVEAECMFGDFQQAMDHLRRHLIATHHPEEIRGGGLLKYSDLLVRNFRPASETEIKSLERYMCSRFFIDFPDVGEQQRKIEAYLQGHFAGRQESSKYDYLMTLRRVIDQSTVCLMGHERRQTLNMITVLALRVLGEQNAIPNAANVTCFYQPAPYVAEPIYSSYFLPAPPPPPPLLYQPFPLHVQLQSGLV